MSDSNGSVSAAAGSEKRRLFVAFEGGGAKGLVHIGALKALEARDFDFKGVAGTSAGAIVAALKAAGYRADEIVDPKCQGTIFDLYFELTKRRMRPTGLFGPFGWKKIQILREACEGSGRALCVLIVAIIGTAFLVHSLTKNISGLHSASAGSFVLLLFCFLSVAFISSRGGIASLDTCRDVINTLIAAKLFPNDPKSVPVMGDFKKLGLPSLRIVASDITAQKLRLFSSDEAKDAKIPVADAVAASACIPFVFRPWKVGGKFHVDGGIVSNLPAWPFDEERALDLDALTLAFQIEESGVVENDASLRNWMMDVALTAAFGSAILNTRAVDRLHVFPMQTKLQTLDFDISLERACDAVRQATAAAEALIVRRLIEIPDLYTDGCHQVQKDVSAALASIPNAIVGSFGPVRVRVGVALAEDGFPNSLRLHYSAGFGSDADDGILLPRNGSYIGEAWQFKESIIGTPPFDELPSPGSRRLYKLFAKDIKWIFATPVFNSYSDRKEPDFVVAIDGSHVLSGDSAVLDNILDVLAQLVDGVFVPIATKLAEGEK